MNKPSLNLLVIARLQSVALLALLCGVAQAQTSKVTEVRVESRNWTQLLSLNGTLTSAQDAAITPRVGGLISEVAIDAGSRVKKGDLLFQLDPALDQLSLKELRAQLAAAQGELSEATRLRDENLPLAEKGLVPSTEAEASKARVQIRQAELQRLEAEIARQQERLRRHRIIAPFDGVIRQRFAEVGEWVDTGKPVADLVAVDTLRLDLQVPQEYFGIIKQGTAVNVTPDARQAVSQQTQVSVSVPVSDPTARTFLIRVELDNSQGQLTPGMSARASIRMQTGEQVLALPRDATLRYPDGSVRVWQIHETDGKTNVAGKQVKLGRAANGLVEIRDGLKAGDRVVLKGNESLSNGDAVQIISNQDKGQ